MENRRNKIIITIMCVIILILVVILVIDKINQKQEEILFYDVSKLKVEDYNNYELFKDITNNQNEIERIYINNDYQCMASLRLDGDVYIQGTKDDEIISGLLKIHEIVDIISFDVPASIDEQLLYMLDSKGNLYSYKIGNFFNKNYEVTKIDKVSNVKKIFISHYSKTNAGGSWALFAITENNDCVMINAQSV